MEEGGGGWGHDADMLLLNLCMANVKELHCVN